MGSVYPKRTDEDEDEGDDESVPAAGRKPGHAGGSGAPGPQQQIDDFSGDGFTKELPDSEIESVTQASEYQVVPSDLDEHLREELREQGALDKVKAPLIEQGTANSDGLYIIEFENGERALFKENDGAGATGRNLNEEVFSHLSRLLGGSIGPESRQITVEVDGEKVTGDMKAFVEGATAVPDAVDWRDVQNGKRPVSELVSENKDTIAKIGVMDYLIGNDDRHGGNMLADDSGQIHAIDNGGMGMPYKAEWEHLMVSRRFVDSDQTNNELLEKDMLSVVETQREILSSMESDPEFREDVIDSFRSVHGEDSRWTTRAEEVLSDSVDDGFTGIFSMMPEKDKAVYEHHLDKVEASIRGEYTITREIVPPSGMTEVLKKI